MSVEIKTSGAYDHFAKKWSVPRDEAKRRVQEIIIHSPEGMDDPEHDNVWSFLHGYNARDVRPDNVS